MSTCTINRPHCESCGSSSPEDVDMFANDGYSQCCNEIIVADHRDCRDHHGER